MEGATLGHFALLEKIGEGGMGRVYKARDSRLDRLVAIKLLPEAKLADADRRARFIQEARSASALNHPNIITIHEIGEQDGQTFIVMELLEGKALNELIPRKGMRLTEALRIAVQVSDALAAAHAAGIVHRDLKPGNIMVDAHGRAKVLDFGLAKLSAPAATAALAIDEETRTVATQPRTEEGVIIGSVPYMSPEQAEGRPVDARSDIFSFGAVLYEMVTGQRAFRGESRISTLAAVVEQDPKAPSELTSSVPLELERVIARCMRKDVNRRSQNMADVKLALEELRDESESGKLARPAAQVAPAPRRWLWPAIAGVCALAAMAAIIWSYLQSGSTQSKGPKLTRLSPDDGHSYSSPAISPDGKLVAYVSDRSDKPELWLHQVGASDPVQLTHAVAPVDHPSFFPDGTRIMYSTVSPEFKTTVEVIPTLGGPSGVILSRKNIGRWATLSPDGRWIAYIDMRDRGLWILPSEGGRAAGTPELGAAPGSQCRFHRAGDSVRAAGLKGGKPSLMTGDRVLFTDWNQDRSNAWELRLSPGSWQVRRTPYQLTYGTENEEPAAISSTGLFAVETAKEFKSLYLTPVASATGQPSGVLRRLNQDLRYRFPWPTGGDLGKAYYWIEYLARRTFPANGYELDLESGKERLVVRGMPSPWTAQVSPDGRRIAYSVLEGNSFSIRIGDAGAGPASARLLCKDCGLAMGFSADVKFLFYRAEATVHRDKNRKYTVRLLDVASGKSKAWLEHPSDSILTLSTFGEDAKWVAFKTRTVGVDGPGAWNVVPWREEAVPPSEWIDVKLPFDHVVPAPSANFFHFFQDGKMVVVRVDPKTRRTSAPAEVRFLPGSPITLRADDALQLRYPGLFVMRGKITQLRMADAT